MEHQKKKLTIYEINQVNLWRKIGLKQIMTHIERITIIAKLNLKLQRLNQVYVIIVMHKYLWVEP